VRLGAILSMILGRVDQTLTMLPFPVDVVTTVGDDDTLGDTRLDAGSVRRGVGVGSVYGLLCRHIAFDVLIGTVREELAHAELWPVIGVSQGLPPLVKEKAPYLGR
jgi:hypothetical protein